jgi:hypothetical protein
MWFRVLATDAIIKLLPAPVDKLKRTGSMLFLTHPSAALTAST